MRPAILNPLFRPVTSLTGIGPKLGQALARLLAGADSGEVPRVIDLLFHLPVAIIDRSRQPGIALAPAGAIVTLKVRVDRHQKPPRGNRRLPYRVFCHDDTGEIGLTFFHANDELAGDAPCRSARSATSAAAWNGSTAGRRWSTPITSSTKRALPICR